MIELHDLHRTHIYPVELQTFGNDAMIVAYNIILFASYLRWLHQPKYNQDIVCINPLVSEEAMQTEGVHFLHHRGFWTDLDFLGSDEVHLSDCRLMRRMQAIRPVLFKYYFIIPFMHYLSNWMVPYLKLVT